MGEALHVDQQVTLRALFNTVIPADAWPGGWEGGVHLLLQQHGSDFMGWAQVPLATAVELADRTVRSAHGRPFAALSAETSVILGARTVAQLTDNMGAADLGLTFHELQQLIDASAPRVDDYPYGTAGVEQRSRKITGGR
jgi:hypothetical protein